MSFEIITLRLVHIVAGTFWVGSSLLMTFFLMPALGAAGPAAGPIMGALRQRRLMTWMPIAATLTILSGARLIWIASAGFSGTYMRTTMGHAFAGGGALAILAFAIGMLVARPAAARMARIGSSMASAPESQRPALAREMDALRRRNTTWSRVVNAMLLAAVAGMAVARYLG